MSWLIILAHLLSAHHLLLTMGSSGAYEGPLTSSITMATPMTSSITIKTHIPTLFVQYVYPHYCSPFQLCFIVYIPPPSPHHMLVIVRHIYYFDYKGNKSDHWFASKIILR